MPIRNPVRPLDISNISYAYPNELIVDTATGKLSLNKEDGPIDISTDGNANTATKLQTGRTFTIGKTGKTFDGTADVNWTDAEIGMTDYLLLSGGVMSGNITPNATNTLDLGSSTNVYKNVYATNFVGNASSATKLQTGRTFTIGKTGKTFDGTGDLTWTATEIGITDYLPLAGGVMSGGIIPSTTNTLDLGSIDKVYKNVYATNFVGNASSATKLATARTIGLSGVTGTAQSFNGTANIVIPVTDVPVALVSGLHSVATSGNYLELGNKPLGTAAPKVAGTAAVGTSELFSREDHVHPVQTTVSGNAGSATKLQTARTIGLSGVTATAQSFNGTANITIPITAVPVALVTGLHSVATSGNYTQLTNKPLATAAPKASGTAAVGTSELFAREDHVHPIQTAISGNSGTATKLATARTLTIGATGKTFDGSANVSWTAAEIGLTKYLPLTGGTITGAVSPNANNTIDLGTSALKYRAVYATTFSGNASTATTLATARSIGLSGVTATAQSFNGSANITIPITAVPVSLVTGLHAVATSGNYTQLTNRPLGTAAPKVAGTAAVGTSELFARQDHVHPVQTTVSGNAGSATKLATARSIGVTGVVSGAAAFDGTANISINTVDTRQIVLQDWVGESNATRYYKLGTMVIDNAGNFGNFKFSGRLGGWVNGNCATFEIMLMNRADYTGNIITSGVSCLGCEPQWATNIVDMVVYKQTDLSHTVWLKCNGYYLFNFEYRAMQHYIQYNGTFQTTVPTGTLSWALSTAPMTYMGAGVFGVSNATMVANKLATARTIGLSGVTATAQSFNGTANITIPITSVPGSIVTAASSSAQGTVTTGTQTFAGAKTFSTSVTSPRLVCSTRGNVSGIAIVYSFTLSTTWSGSGPYTQAVTVSGVTSSDTGVWLDVTFSGTYSTDKTRDTEFGKIYRAVTAANKVTVYAHTKPTTSLPVRLTVVR